MTNLRNKILEHKKVILIVGAVVLVFMLIAGSCTAYVYSYNGDFYPGVSVGAVNIGGHTKSDGASLVNQRVNKLFDDGVEVSVNGSTKTIPLRTISQDDPDLSRDLVILDTNSALNEAYSIGRRGSLFQRAFEIGSSLIIKPVVNVKADTDKASIQAELLYYFDEYYDPSIEPALLILPSEEDPKAWTITVVDGHAGRTFDLDKASTSLIASLSNLNIESLNIAVIDGKPTMTTDDVADFEDKALLALKSAPYTFVYDGGRFDQYEFKLKSADLAKALTVVNEDGELRLSVNQNANEFFDKIIKDINTDSQDAKFEISGDRVSEFQPSKDGRAVNVEATIDAIEQAISNLSGDNEAVGTIAIAVEVVAPNIPTGSVNDLGITEILGVGRSDFSGSPSNRIKNLQHGISKLNGVLIAPGVEYSLIAQLRPFTLEDGYLPEMIIKGDQIIPGIGGGLCQIGTTAFRALMNSGLNVTQRRNHSLVVSYYNDASNGNPGTDATLYDPNPDLKFINDTGNYILLTTLMDVPTGNLEFTFWGTSDGRKGYYSPPVVNNWISAGPPKTTYTSTLPPGVRKCQGAYRGANTSFTYYVEQPNGEVKETVYESYYRPLPTICLVGLAEGQAVGEDGGLVEAPVVPEVVVEEEVVDASEVVVE